MTLIEARPRILPALPEGLAKSAHEELEALGVRVLVTISVSEVTATTLKTKSSDDVHAHIKIRAAVVHGPGVPRDLDGFKPTRSNRLIVRQTLQTTRDDPIFAIVDCCFVRLDGAARPVPPRAQAANQMALTAYPNIRRLLANARPVSFVYRDRGSLVSTGRLSTVGSLMGNVIGGRPAMEGRLAHAAYLSLYRIHLIGIHDWFKGLAFIRVGHVSQVVRPTLKLHRERSRGRRLGP